MHLSNRCQIERTVGKVLAFHIENSDSVPVTEYGPQALPGVNMKHNAKNKP